MIKPNMNPAQNRWENGKFVTPGVLEQLGQPVYTPGQGRPLPSPAVTAPGVAGGIGGAGSTSENPGPYSDPNDLVPSFASKYLGGHNPSLINALGKGGDGVKDWIQGGGSVIPSAIYKATGINPMDPLGITKAIFGPPRRTNAIDEWGTIDANAERGGTMDFSGYMSANKDVADAYSTLKQNDPRGWDYVRQSFDFNQNGDVDPGEYAQFHWQHFGENEGRSGVSERPTFESLQAARQQPAQQPTQQPQTANPVATELLRNPALKNQLLMGLANGNR